MNSIDPAILFTFESETCNSLPFLDILVTSNTSNFSTTVYHKPSSVCLPPHFKSCHLGGGTKKKLASFYSYVFRVLQVCSSKLSLDEKLNYLKAIAIDRGFSPNIINQAVKNFSSQHTKRQTLVLGDYKNSVVIPSFHQLAIKLHIFYRNLTFRSFILPSIKFRVPYSRTPFRI
ncbi:hypothetical protein X975_23809, partial [Stegodyphus mimosarum]